MAGSTTIPILSGLVSRGELKDFKLETIEEEPGSGMREHDRLTLVLPSGEQIVIDTFCSGVSENTSIYIDNAAPPTEAQGTVKVCACMVTPCPHTSQPVCDCECHSDPRGFYHCFSLCKCDPNKRK